MLKAIETSQGDEHGNEKVIKSLALVKNSINLHQILLQFIQYNIIKDGKMIKKSQLSKFIYDDNHKLAQSIKSDLFADRSISDNLFSKFEVKWMAVIKMCPSFLKDLTKSHKLSRIEIIPMIYLIDCSR